MNKPRMVMVKKNMGEGLTNSTFPSFLNVGQRHFEKEKPSGVDVDSTHLRFILPVDLLALTYSTEMVAEVESVEMVYKRRGAA